MKTYQNLCTQYYDIDKPNAPADALKFYLEYAKHANGPIFEPMCGTGRFLIPMLERGFDIEGSDASTHMLSICDEKCQAKNLKPKLYHQFLHQMEFNKKFGFIFIPSGSFGLLTDVAEAKHCLKILYDHLLPNGKLVFEVETIHAVPDELGQHQQSTVHNAQNSEKIVLDTVSSYDKESQIIETICQYNLILNDKIVQTEIENLRVRYYQDNEMDKWLPETGFKVFSRYKAFNNETPAINDEIIIYECIK
jgi:2-polyprenyl-3-methyl-5-hydroxy-6-metoxy-1,4-benzoquinol methylase